MGHQGQLWMGCIQPCMSENFILNSFRLMGEEPSSIRLMKNKATGENAGYCFISFATDQQAASCMQRLNGKPIPRTNPVVRFKLNTAVSSHNRFVAVDNDHSVWVGDLTQDVDDCSLFSAFQGRYQSIRSAKVVTDQNGFSRGYGFVKFGHEEDQQRALAEMNGYVGLGSNPIRICNAKNAGHNNFQRPQPQPQPSTSSATAVVQNGYEQHYMQHYAQYPNQIGAVQYQQMSPTTYYAPPPQYAHVSSPAPVPTQYYAPNGHQNYHNYQ